MEPTTNAQVQLDRLKCTIRYLKWLAVNGHGDSLVRLLSGLEVAPLPPTEYLSLVLDPPRDV